MKPLSSGKMLLFFFWYFVAIFLSGFDVNHLGEHSKNQTGRFLHLLCLLYISPKILRKLVNGNGFTDLYKEVIWCKIEFHIKSLQMT